MHVIDGVNVTPAQAEVYAVVKEFGPLPDHALVPLAQHANNIKQSSSGIRTRRCELVRKGLVSVSSKSWRTASGRRALGYEA